MITTPLCLRVNIASFTPEIICSLINVLYALFWARYKDRHKKKYLLACRNNAKEFNKVITCVPFCETQKVDLLCWPRVKFFLISYSLHNL